jgi:hypothetical protein
MTTIEKLRAKQNSRLTAIRAEEANAKLFYLQANGRRQKTSFTHFIESGVCYSHQEKSSVFYNHFSTHFGPPAQRNLTLRPPLGA